MKQNKKMVVLRCGSNTPSNDYSKYHVSNDVTIRFVRSYLPVFYDVISVSEYLFVCVITPSKTYQAICADPPWSYKNYSYARTKEGKKARRGVVKEYQTMTLDEIKQLPVGEIAAENSVLFLWATCPLLPEALEVLKSWGFTYYTVGFVWVKTNKKAGTLFWGMGNMTRSNAEVCFIGVKGKLKRISASVHSILMSPVREHSRKPNEVESNISLQVSDGTPSIFVVRKTEGKQG